MKEQFEKFLNHECCGGHHDHEHEEGCGCGCHDHDEQMEMVTLSLEDGTEMHCGIIGVFEVEEKEYIALVNEEDQVLLYRYLEPEQEGGSATLELFESDEEYDLVSKAFYEIYVEEEDTELGDVEE